MRLIGVYSFLLFIKKNMSEIDYCPPIIEVVEIAVECGFIASNSPLDYEPGGPL